MSARSHVHDFNEWLVFLGSDMAKVFDFDAEIEIYMGEENELHVITKPTLYIPKGLVHCPLNFKKIGKPILFQKIYISAKYTREFIPFNSKL